MIRGENWKKKKGGLVLTAMYFLDVAGFRHSKMLPLLSESRTAKWWKSALLDPFVEVSGCIEQL